MIRYPIRSFSSGELSPQLDCRNDLDKYERGCRTLQNMIPRIYGPAERRPGTKYIETCGGVSRVIPFIYSSTIAYVILLEDQVMYFYYNGAQVNDGDGNRLSVTTPYLEADLFELQYKQVNDVMWIVHQDYAPRKLKRTSATEFRLETIEFNVGPFKRRNDLVYENGVTITPSRSGPNGTSDITDETGALYNASSTLNTTAGAAKAFDNKMSGSGYYWQTDLGDYQNQWVSVQYTAKKTIVQVDICPFAARPSQENKLVNAFCPKHVKIEASNDGAAWTKIPINGWAGDVSAYNTNEATLGNITLQNEWVQLRLNNATGYFYWRVFVYDNYDSLVIPLIYDSCIRIAEIEMYESSASFNTSATLTASDEIFTSGDVGALYALTQPRAATELTTSTSAPTAVTTASILVEGEFAFNTHGTWAGTVALQRTTDLTVWETYRTWISNSDRNVQYTGIENETGVHYRIVVSAITSGTIYCDLTVNSSTETGICRVTAYTSPTVVDVDIIKNFASTDATARWFEGSFSPKNGYPGAIAFFEQRCVYAGTTDQPQTVWLSATDDYEYFNEGTNDDDGFSITLASETRNAIQWVSGLEALIIGTTGGEWRLRSSSYDEPLTPTNFSCKRQTTYGCKDIQALTVNDIILFVDFVGRKVREISYNSEREKFIAPDLTALAEHITEGGIVDFAYQKNPDPLLWCVLGGGTIALMTYEREQNVVAWSEQTFTTGSEPTTGYGAQSVCVIPSSTEDEVWLVVKRYINSATVYMLEQMQPRAVSDQEDQWFVDCGLGYDSTATTTISGLDHLEGESVTILADGAAQASKTVSSGAITLTDSASRVIAGIPFRYTLQPMRFDIDSQGTTKGTIKTFKEVVISFYKTLNAQYGTDTSNLFEIDWRTEEAYGSPPALFTGDKVVTHEGGFTVEDEFVISDNGPFPCTVRCLVPRIEITGR